MPHRSRWTLDLPSTGGVKTYCHEVLDRVLDKLSREANTDEALKKCPSVKTVVVVKRTGGQIGWADPSTGLSFAYLTNGIDRNIARLYRRGNQLATLAAACVA